MKKSFLGIVSLVVLVSLFTACGAGAYGGMTGQGIDVEAAKQAAVAHAGFNVAKLNQYIMTNIYL